MKNSKNLIFIAIFSLILTNLKSAEIVMDLTPLMAKGLIDEDIQILQDSGSYKFAPGSIKKVRNHFFNIDKEIKILMENDTFAQQYIAHINDNKQLSPEFHSYFFSNSSFQQKIKQLGSLLQRFKTIKIYLECLEKAAHQLKSNAALSVPNENKKDLIKINQLKCLFCKKFDANKNFQQCSRCKIAKYCSADCQRADWSKHKLICKPKENENSTAAAGAGAGAETIETTPDFSNIEVD